MVAGHIAGLLGLYGVVCHLSSGLLCLQTKRVEETLRKDHSL